VASLLQTFLDKGIAPLAALAGVGITLMFTGRREKERAERENIERDKQEQRDKAARLRERRVELFVDVSQHLEEWINALLRMLNSPDPTEYPFGSLRPLVERTPGLAGPMALLAYDDMEDLWRDFEQRVISVGETVDWWMEANDLEDGTEVGEAVSRLEETGQALFESATKMSASLRLAVTRIDTE
jgi:hypothetical protein